MSAWAVSPDGREALAFKDDKVFLTSAAVPSIDGAPACCDPDNPLRGGDWMPGDPGLIAWSSSTVHRLDRSGQGLSRGTALFAAPPGESVVSAIAGRHGNVLVATLGSEANSLYFCGKQGVRLLYTAELLSPPSRCGEFACVVERTRQRILRISLETAEVETALDATDGVTDPVSATGLSKNDDLLYVVSARDRILHVFQLSTRRLMAQQPLEYEPCGIAEQPGGRYMRVETCGETDPLLLVPAGQTAPVWFVPRTEVR